MVQCYNADKLSILSFHRCAQLQTAGESEITLSEIGLAVGQSESMYYRG